MAKYLTEMGAGGSSQHTVRKTRFQEILQGLSLGAAYAFDEESYGRFYPLAREEGLPVVAADFAAARARGERYVTVQLVVQ